MNILIVDDNIELVDFLKRGLEGEGFKVIYAMRGKEALRLLGKYKVDLIILDLLLPDLGGEQVFKRLRRKRIDTPILVLTGVSRLDKRIKLFNLGACDYLCKPFSFVELVSKINLILSRSKRLGKEPDLIEIRDLKIDIKSRQVLRDGRAVKLRYKEFELLLYLAKNSDKVISREDLLKNVWRYNSLLVTNTVDSHISSIRRKLKSESGGGLIETAHGTGYIIRNN